ncbi:hypothetical protein ACJJTC_010504 [Scirpophaga incertulas]
MADHKLWLRCFKAIQFLHSWMVTKSLDLFWMFLRIVGKTLLSTSPCGLLEVLATLLTSLNMHVAGHDSAVRVMRSAAVHGSMHILAVLRSCEWQKYQRAIIQDLSVTNIQDENVS